MIKLFATDVDGTLTDGCMLYADNGLELKRFNFRDGYGFQLLREAGIKTAIITSETTDIVQRRADKLKVDYLSMGNRDKLGYMKKLCMDLKIDLSDVAYIGDDVNDAELLQAVGYSACPNDAHEKVRDIKNILVMSSNGGCGTVREFIDYLLAKLIIENDEKFR